METILQIEETIKEIEHKYSNTIIQIIMFEKIFENITDQNILEYFSKSPVQYIRKIVAWKIKNLDYIKTLSNDDYYGVKTSLCFNKNTPISILEILSNDEHHKVRKYSLSELNRRKEKVD